MHKPAVDTIEIRGARVHNLKNIDLDLPLKKLVCFAGPSGSGKTSLAFHTLLTESKRRFVNSFPNSMKFFTERPAAVDVDRIFPVLPVFGLPQINPVFGARSVVSDIMRLTDDLQNLFFGFSRELCPVHRLDLAALPVSTQVRSQLPKSVEKGVFYLLLSPLEHQRVFGEDFIPARSYSQRRRTMEAFSPEDELVEVFRFKVENLESIDRKWQELKLHQYRLSYQLWGEGMKKPQGLNFHYRRVCPECDFESNPVTTVSAFSPYSALGACPACNGYGANLTYDPEKLMDRELSIAEGGLRLLNYGAFYDDYEAFLKLAKKKKIPLDVPIKKLPREFFQWLEHGEGAYPGFAELKRYLDSKKYKPSVRIYIRQLQKEVPCLVCQCSRLNQRVLHYRVRLKGELWGLRELMELNVGEAAKVFAPEAIALEPHQEKLRAEIFAKLELARELGLDHLALLRKAKGLSAGEYQRLLLIKYLSFKGTDSLFVLDEPSVGLAEPELRQLLSGLRQIIAQGNTVVLIDHSQILQEASDHLVVMGPASGKGGGEIIYQGNPAAYFRNKEEVRWEIKKDYRPMAPKLELRGAEIFGRAYPDLSLPLQQMTWVTGPSGSGKSSLLVKVLANELHKRLHQEALEDCPYQLKALKAPVKFDDVVVISSELNRFTSRSSVGTVTELSSVIRKHFLKLPVAKSMNLKEGHLSSNSELGMCPRCEGKGQIIIEMQYLEDIVLECEDCKGLKI
jgi:excinuclease ABC subunit A